MKKKSIRLLLMLFMGMWSTLAFSQAKKTITGTVKDDAGAPLIGATVKVVGTKTATATDAEGNFSIQAASSNQLEITSVGFESQQVAIGNQSEINITLNRANS